MDKNVFATSPTDFLNKFLLYVGLWPSELNFNFRKLMYHLYTIAFQLIFSFLYTTFKCINFLHLKDLSDLFQTLFICLEETSFCIKVVNIYFHLKLVRKCSVLITEFTYETDEERNILKSELKFFNTIKVWYFGIAGMATILSYVTPLFMTDIKLIFPGWYPLDWKNNRFNYWFIYVYQAIGILIMVNTLIVIECYAIYLLTMIKLQFTIIGLRLTKIGYRKKRTPLQKNVNRINRNDVNDERLTIADEQSQRLAIHEIINCIKVHKLTIRLASHVEEIFTIPFFVQFGVSGIVLCVAAFQATFNSAGGATAELLFYFCFVMTMLTQIFIPCYLGSEILLKSNSLTIDTYNSDWIVLASFYRKYLIIFRERLKRPSMIMVGSIFELSLRSFSGILNKSYGLFAVLQSFVKSRSTN